MTSPLAKKPPRVFISYSHESAQHDDNVLRIANELRTYGIDTLLDQYNPYPSAGWHRWMRKHIQSSDFVLMVCTPDYYRCTNGHIQAGAEMGVCWEANLIYNELYVQQAAVEKYVPILLANGNPANIPNPLRGHTYYRLPGDFLTLYRRLTNQRETPAADLGTLTPLPPRPRAAGFRLTPDTGTTASPTRSPAGPPKDLRSPRASAGPLPSMRPSNISTNPFADILDAIGRPRPGRIKGTGGSTGDLLDASPLDAGVYRERDKVRRFTDIRFPGTCTVSEVEYLTIRLSRAPATDSAYVVPIDLSIEHPLEVTALSVVVSGEAFSIEPRCRTLLVPPVGDSDVIAFGVMPRDAGHHSIDVEFYCKADRVGYVVVTTEVRGQGGTAGVNQAATAPTVDIHLSPREALTGTTKTLKINGRFLKIRLVVDR